MAEGASFHSVWRRGDASPRQPGSFPIFWRLNYPYSFGLPAGAGWYPLRLPFGNVYGSIDAPLDAARGWRVLDANAYFQDDYKVSSRLSLNLGFRYERLGDVSDSLGRVSNFNMNTADANLAPGASSYQGLIVASNYSGAIAPPTGVVKGEE